MRHRRSRHCWQAAQDPASGCGDTRGEASCCCWVQLASFAELKGQLDEMWGIDKPLPFGFQRAVENPALSLEWCLFWLSCCSYLSSSARIGHCLHAMQAEFWACSCRASRNTLLIFRSASQPVFCRHLQDLPDAPLSWRDVWIGAAFTAGLFQLGKYAICLYLGNSGVASSFGAAGSLIALAAMGVLLGTDFLSGGGVHAALRTLVRQPAA